MEEVEKSQKIKELVQQIKECQGEVKSLFKQACQHAHRCGTILLELRKRFEEHGTWQPFIKKEFEDPGILSYDTVSAYMRIAKHWKEFPELQETNIREFLQAIKDKKQEDQQDTWQKTPEEEAEYRQAEQQEREHRENNKVILRIGTKDLTPRQSAILKSDMLTGCYGLWQELRRKLDEIADAEADKEANFAARQGKSETQSSDAA